MKLMRRKPRDPSILERELELQKEYESKSPVYRDTIVELYDSRIMYSIDKVIDVNASLMELIPKILSSPICKLGTPSLFLLELANTFIDKSMIDPVTGKYVLLKLSSE